MIIRYTEKGLLVMNEIGSFRKYILNYEKLNIPIFYNENELIENLKNMYIYDYAMKLENKFLSLLDAIFGKNNLSDKKRLIYEELYISTVFSDEKLLNII